MALAIGLAGEPNTGKSFSRSFLKDIKSTFVLMPSRKASYLKDAKPFQPVKGEKGEIKGYEGNYMVLKTTDLEKVSKTLENIAKSMPHIKTIIIPDFTHYISTILASKNFIMRKAGGEAFQRFWELAGETLNSFFLKASELRDDLIIVIEFHTELNESTGTFQLFVPGGKMLTEKFKADSYFDILLYTYVMPDEENQLDNKDKYKFVVKRANINGVNYPARSMELFADIAEDGIFIPNNLELVLSKLRNSNIL